VRYSEPSASITAACDWASTRESSSSFWTSPNFWSKYFENAITAAGSPNSGPTWPALACMSVKIAALLFDFLAKFLREQFLNVSD
jgi:hypothetical protein